MSEDLKLEFAILDETNGDRPAAVSLLVDRVVSDPNMVKAHIRDWAKVWAEQKIHRALAGWREKIIARVNNPGNFASALAGAMEAEYTRLMDMPLFGGKRLGEATSVEVRESADRYASVSKDMARKAKWQFAVADAAEKNGDSVTPIRSVLSEATLTRLWSEADA